ncbi:MAG TPA: IS4 family transposase [Pyrinomonadaceae bacterium]|nr:IS4 family transposase [Pyrinomonadaceae bacterium]
MLVIGMAYARSVCLPQAATSAPVKGIQLDSRVARFERLLRCEKFVPLEVLRPFACRMLEELSRHGRDELLLIMDRTMINDTVNLLYVSVGYHGRALPVGWLLVPHDGNSSLALQQELLRWVKNCCPAAAPVTIVADREFHSIHLATWLEWELSTHFILRIKAGTFVERSGAWIKAGELAEVGWHQQFDGCRVTKDPKTQARYTVMSFRDAGEDEPWLLLTNVAEMEKVYEQYGRRFWIEEMFSGHKSRGLNLEKTRLTDPHRVQRLLVAVTFAYRWLMQIGSEIVNRGWWRQVDNRAATRTVSLCQIGLRWLRESLLQNTLPPPLTGCFRPLIDT